MDIIPKTVKGVVKDLLKSKDEREVMDFYVRDLGLTHFCCRLFFLLVVVLVRFCLFDFCLFCTFLFVIGMG